MTRIEYLIIGAGPTGLGAAVRMRELGCRDFLVLESNDYVGGLSASYKDGAGFTWDVGGHVLFSRSADFIRRIKGLMEDSLLEHERKAQIRFNDRWIDYPFQEHIAQLPQEQAKECLEGMIKARGKDSASKEGLAFDQWMEATFGRGICQLFMKPYNRKVWAVPLDTMSSTWIKDRVSLPVLEELKEHSATGTRINKWGPNSTFFYPLSGGTGEIFKNLAKHSKEHILSEHDVVEVDLEKRTARTSNGRIFQYRHLLNTSPLDRFIREIAKPAASSVLEAADLLKHNGVAIIGVGINSHKASKTSWMYFPDQRSPFYRVTNLHNYSPHITPEAGKHMALLTETAFSDQAPLQMHGFEQRVLGSLIKTGLCGDNPVTPSFWQRIEEYGYPIPCLNRDQALEVIQPFLEEKDVFSRGRFGGWKYEIGNMDHSFIQGMEWADRMITDKEELMYYGR